MKDEDGYRTILGSGLGPLADQRQAEGQRLRKLPAQGAVPEVSPARASALAAEVDRGEGYITQ
jgi:hypothetical protein